MNRITCYFEILMTKSMKHFTKRNFFVESYWYSDKTGTLIVLRKFNAHALHTNSHSHTHSYTYRSIHTRSMLHRSWTAATLILTSGWGCCGLPVTLQSFKGVYGQCREHCVRGGGSRLLYCVFTRVKRLL